jgi:hypothetical protein
VRLLASSFPTDSIIEEVCVICTQDLQGYGASQVEYTDFLTAIVSDMRVHCGGLRRFQIAAVMAQDVVDEEAAIAAVQMRFPDLRVHL